MLPSNFRIWFKNKGELFTMKSDLSLVSDCYTNYSKNSQNMFTKHIIIIWIYSVIWHRCEILCLNISVTNMSNLGLWHYLNFKIILLFRYLMPILTQCLKVHLIPSFVVFNQIFTQLWILAQINCMSQRILNHTFWQNKLIWAIIPMVIF